MLLPEHEEHPSLFQYKFCSLPFWNSITNVKLVTMYVLFATKAGIDLAAYFLPANATIYPPTESGEKLLLLTVRREISSTLGRKTESCEFEEDRDSLLSQGDNWTELLKKKAVFAAKAIPKVKPSDLCTVASAHGEKTWLLSLLDSTKYAVVEKVVTTAMSRIVVTGIAMATANMV